jgi:hypothetical protein
MGDDTWLGISPQAITGFGGTQVGSGSGGVASGVDASITTPEAANPPLYSPQNPLFWLGVLLLAAGGLFHLSTSASAGPAKASLSI